MDIKYKKVFPEIILQNILHAHPEMALLGFSSFLTDFCVQNVIYEKSNVLLNRQS